MELKGGASRPDAECHAQERKRLPPQSDAGAAGDGSGFIRTLAGNNGNGSDLLSHFVPRRSVIILRHMPDLLVRLYDLPDLSASLAEASAGGAGIRRALVPEKRLVLDWVRRQWTIGWADECEAAFARQPVSCFLAIGTVDPADAGVGKDPALLGFACYDATCRNFFGPIGVVGNARTRGIGKALTLACLHAMAAAGYAYAIIGWAGPVGFFERAVGATVIGGSEPGIYRGMLRGAGPVSPPDRQTHC